MEFWCWNSLLVPVTYEEIATDLWVPLWKVSVLRLYVLNIVIFIKPMKQHPICVIYTRIQWRRFTDFPIFQISFNLIHAIINFYRDANCSSVMSHSSILCRKVTWKDIMTAVNFHRFYFEMCSLLLLNFLPQS